MLNDSYKIFGKQTYANTTKIYWSAKGITNMELVWMGGTYANFGYKQPYKHIVHFRISMCQRQMLTYKKDKNDYANKLTKVGHQVKRTAINYVPSCICKTLFSCISYIKQN